MNEKMKKAEYLFSELSGIDERLVAEALEVKGKRTGFGKRAVVVLVAAALLMSLFVGSFVIGNIVGDKKQDSVEPVVSDTFEESLADAERSSRVMSYRSTDDIDLFDGAAKIVWSDGDGYNVIRLSGESEQKKLYSAMNKSFAGAKAVGEGDDTDVLVWISFGDGRVMTPYLRNTVGNVGYGTLFEYEAEIVPTSDMSKFVNLLVSS